MRKVLVVGAGLIGNKRASNLPDNMIIHGVVDVDLDLAEKFAKIYSTRYFKEIDEALVNLGNGSLVVISTRHKDLYPLANKAISAGMHVLIEKPGSISSLQMESLIKLATEHNVTLSVGYNHRFHPAALKLREISDSNQFGPIQLIRARYGHGGRWGYEKEWRTNKELSGGGELLDQGCHLLDLLLFYGVQPELEFSMLPTLYWDIKVEDNAFLAGNIGQNAKFWLHASWTEWKNLFSFEVFYKTAKVEWAGLNGSYGPETLRIFHMESGLGIPKVFEFEYLENDNSWKLELIEIEKRINNEPSISASGLDGLKILEIIGKAYSQ